MKLFKRILSACLVFSMAYQACAGAMNDYSPNLGGSKGFDVAIKRIYLSKPDFEIGDQVTVMVDMEKTGNVNCPQQWLDIRNMVGCTAGSGRTDGFGFTSQGALAEDGSSKTGTLPGLKITANKISFDVTFYADDNDKTNNYGIHFEAESTKNAVDLTVKEIRVEPTNFKAGDKLKVYANVHNVGGLSADYSMMEFGVTHGRQTNKFKKPVTFAPKEEKEIEIGEIVADSEDFDLTVTANTNKSVNELYYTNNSLTNNKKSYVSNTDYIYEKLGIASGGAVVNEWMDPVLKRTYILTDVGGFYKYNYTLDTFEHYGVNSGEVSGNACMSLQGQYGNENLLFAMFGGSYGSTRGYADYGDIYRSMDGGRTWKNMNFPNDIRIDARWTKQLALDQKNPNILYALSHNGAVYKTENALSAAPVWQKINLPGFSPVYAPDKAGLEVDAGNTTMSMITDDTSVYEGRSKNVYISATGNGIYQSSDGGKTFKLMPGSPKNVHGMDVDSKGNLYACVRAENGGFWKYDGQDWICIFNTADPLLEMDISPFDEDTMVISSKYAIWVTQDGGESFRKISSGSNVINSSKFNDGHGCWNAVGALTFDPINPKSLWFGDFYGVFKTEDFTRSTVEFIGRGHNFEELVLEGVKAYKTADRLSTITMDGQICVKEGDSYFDKWQSERAYATSITTSHCQDYCLNHPDFIVSFGGSGWDMNPTNGSYTFDAGKTWVNFDKLIPYYPGTTTTAAICNCAVSPEYNENGVPTIIVGTAKGYIYRTDDLGKNWTIVSDDMAGKVWGHSVYMVSDPYTNGVFYLYSMKDGTFLKSVDDGKTFQAVSKLPFTVEPDVKVLYEKENHLAVALKNAGLWLSADGGVTFEKIPLFNYAKAVGVGKPQNGSEYDTLFVIGKVGKDDLGVYQSTDFGKSWEKCDMANFDTYASLGSIDGDKFREGVFYAATGGMTLLVGMPKDKNFKPYRFQLEQEDGITVKDSKFTLSGACDTITEVEIDLNGEKYTADVDIDYSFSNKLTLKEGVNTITAKVGNGDNMEERTIKVIQDPNYISIDFNSYNAETKEESMFISGKVNCDATVTLNGEPLSVSDKRFTAELNLVAGENEFLFEAKDENGNSKTEKLVIVRDIVPPEITFNYADGTEVNDCYVVLEANISEDVTVEFGGTKTTCDAGVNIFKKVLSAGTNKLVFNLTDKNGNRAQKILTLHYNDPEFNSDPMAVDVKYGAPEIDGVRADGEWRIDRIANIIAEGDSDNIARFGVQSDGKYLYVGIDVQDQNVLFADEPNANATGNDSVEIFIDADNDKTASYTSRDFQLRADTYGSVFNCSTGKYVEGAESKTGLTADGYFMEVKIPLSEVKLDYVPGGVFGIDISVNGAETLGTRKYVISWSGDRSSWLTTVNWGIATFK